MNRISTREQAEALLAEPTPRWILKHSATCGVSAAAHEEVETFLATHPMPAAMLVVQEARPLSNWLATHLGYAHRTPQLFLLTDGKVAWHASHWGITSRAMEQALAQRAGASAG